MKLFRFLSKILIVVAVLLAGFFIWLSSSFSLSTTVDLERGQTFSVFLQKLGSLDALKVRVHAKINNINLNAIQEGRYAFDGTYSPQEFIDIILAGVEPEYMSFTVLEGWSTYDIDESLAQKGYIQAGDFIAYTHNQDTIQKRSAQYDFLRRLGDGKLASLEGFLYPDTYFLDENAPVSQQLVRLQLDTFKQKIWDEFHYDFDNFHLYSAYLGFDNVDLSSYDILILSTVVEKEERVDRNKPIIAGLFMNRLARGERIDADITLCYGLEQSYEGCTPSIIVKHLYDDTNLYNTRQLHGLPPTAIANPTASSVQSVLDFTKTDYMFYLHDPRGDIHFAKTLSEHNANKSKYLN